MDSAEISNIFREAHRHTIKWFSSKEGIREKKYVYLWAKYSLESKRNPEKRKAFKQKIAEYLRIEKEHPTVDCSYGFGMRVALV